MSGNLTSLQLQLYYKNKLDRQEKSQFLKYLMAEFDYSYSSIQQKMTGAAELNKRDIILISEVVKNEAWKG